MDPNSFYEIRLFVKWREKTKKNKEESMVSVTHEKQLRSITDLRRTNRQKFFNQFLNDTYFCM